MSTPTDPAVDIVIVIQEALNTPGANVVAIARRALDEYAARERERCAAAIEDEFGEGMGDVFAAFVRSLS